MIDNLKIIENKIKDAIEDDNMAIVKTQLKNITALIKELTNNKNEDNIRSQLIAYEKHHYSDTEWFLVMERSIDEMDKYLS